jgi:hypothetical protein
VSIKEEKSNGLKVVWRRREAKEGNESVLEMGMDEGDLIWMKEQLRLTSMVMGRGRFWWIWRRETSRILVIH